MSSPRDLLALLGGTPLVPGGPSPWPRPDERVRQALEAAYADGAWGQYQGPRVQHLEERLATEHDVPHALACGSGTYAVELGLRALGVGPDDEVALAAYDYGGNFHTVHALGARPVLVDLDVESWQLSVERLAEALGPGTRAVVASHLHGGLVPMRELTALAAARGIGVVEDAAQCPGARLQGRPAGAWGDVGVLSFGGSKLLCSGRGGALLVRSAAVLQKARLIHTRAGNVVCPLSELQAAVLLPQLDRLEEDTRRRARAARRVLDGLEGVPGVRPFAPPRDGDLAGYYKLGLRFDAEAFGLSRDVFTAAMRAEGVALDEGFRALHAGRSRGRYRAGGELGEADRAHREAVVLHHPVLLEEDEAVAAVAAAVRKVHAHREELARWQAGG